MDEIRASLYPENSTMSNIHYLTVTYSVVNFLDLRFRGKM